MAHVVLVIVHLGALAISAAVALFATYRILTYPENHVGWNILAVVPIAAVGLAAGLLLHRRTKRRAHLIGALALALIALAAVLAYTGNVLVPYEVWLRRGMPPPPF